MSLIAGEEKSGWLVAGIAVAIAMKKKINLSNEKNEMMF